MAKRIQVSDDAGTNWYTLPGNTGEIRSEGQELNDTIFGQSFQSSEIGLINGQITSNALYKGFAGYHADIRQMAGSTTTFTQEACSQESGLIYAIDDPTMDVWDHTQAIIIRDDAADVTDEVEWIDFLRGRFKFRTGYVVVGVVDATGEFFPKTTVAKGRTFNLTQTMAPIDDTDLATAQANTGRNTYEYGLKTVALEIGNVYDVTNGWRTVLEGRALVIIDLAPVGNAGSNSYARGVFKVARHAHQGDVGALEEETVNFTLAVPQESDVATVGFDNDLFLTPFVWTHPSGTNLATAVQKLLEAWEDDETLEARYLPDGVNGVEGDVVVSEISLTGGLEALNEFQVTLMISGALATAP
jgi:hypothetical protein